MSDKFHIEPVQKTATAEELENNIAIILAIFGMYCPRCALRVRNSLISTTGVTEALVDYMAGMAKVVFNPDLVIPPVLLEAVERAGADGQYEYWAILLG